jgi:hypothetical protein
MTVIVANTDVSGTLASSNPSLQYTLRLQSSGADESYLKTPIGIYGKLDVTNRNLWSMCFVTRDSAFQYVEPATLPFPAPFRPGKHLFVYLPVNSAEQQQGSVYIYDASADLIRSIPLATSSVFRNKQVFTWDGRTNGGTVAPSGVYIYVISVPGRELKGKIPLVRE